MLHFLLARFNEDSLVGLVEDDLAVCIKVSKGVVASSLDEVKKALQELKFQLVGEDWKLGLKGGVHIVKADQIEDIAAYGFTDRLLLKLRNNQHVVYSQQSS
ncbi:hypothetical protein ACFE04_022916 [Oxalis oulophora]